MLQTASNWLLIFSQTTSRPLVHITPVASMAGCATCNKPAPKRCSRCIEGLDIHEAASPTYYCSAECQKIDFAAHKIICRNANYRKQLFRAGKLLADLWYASSRESFTCSIAQANVEDGELSIRRRVYTPGHIFTDFPAHLITSEETRRALVSWRMCSVGVSRMFESVQAALKGTLLHCCTFRAPVQADASGRHLHQDAGGEG